MSDFEEPSYRGSESDVMEPRDSDDGGNRYRSSQVDDAAIQINDGARVHPSKDNDDNERKGMSVTFSDLSYTISYKEDQTLKERFQKKQFCGAPSVSKTILKDISGSIKPGCLTALMGPSGAGKSTLLDVLAGRKHKGDIKGLIRFDGDEAPSNFRQISAYVQQTDILMPTLKVFELLYYTAELKLPKSFSTEQKKQRVEDVIEQLGLESCADTVIGDRLTRGISGGQAKRVNIGMELVTDPCLIFLDEPTTGLDSAIALEVMNVVRNLTNRGRSVVCTIHQPSTEIFQLFDRLLLLVLGEVVYEGERRLAVDYFRNFGYEVPRGMNPSDFLMDIVGEDMEDGERLVPGEVREPSFFVEEYKKSTVYQDRLISVRQGLQSKRESEIESRRTSVASTAADVASSKMPFINSFTHEFVILCQRSFRGRLRDQTYIMNSIVKYLIFSIVFMSIYWDLPKSSTGMFDRFAFIFLTIAVLAFSAFDFLPGLLQDRQLFYRERASGTYRASSYILSYIVTGAPFSFIGVIFYSCVTYFAVGLDSRFQDFLYFVVFVVLVQDLGIALGHATSAFCPDMDSSAAFLNVLVTISIFFCGFGLTPDDIPNYWIWAYWTSFMKYGVEGLSMNEFENNWYGGCNKTAVTDIFNYACEFNTDVNGFEYSGSAFNSDKSIELNKWYSLVIIFFYSVFLHILSYIGIRYVNFDNK